MAVLYDEPPLLPCLPCNMPFPPALFLASTGEQVQGLMWLPGGVIAAVAYVDGKDGAGAPQLLLYPQYHLDNASLLARLPLKQVRWCRWWAEAARPGASCMRSASTQHHADRPDCHGSWSQAPHAPRAVLQVPVAMDSAGWHLVLAFHPLEVKLFRWGALVPTSCIIKLCARLFAC